MKPDVQRHASKSLLSILAVRRSALLAVLVAVATIVVPARAQQAKPDPAGIATGDRSSVVDAGGTPLVVAEPTDKSAPDYEKNKKAYEEFKAQADKEPLAMK